MLAPEGRYGSVTHRVQHHRSVTMSNRCRQSQAGSVTRFTRARAFRPPLGSELVRDRLHRGELVAVVVHGVGTQGDGDGGGADVAQRLDPAVGLVGVTDRVERAGTEHDLETVGQLDLGEDLAERLRRQTERHPAVPELHRALAAT